MSIVTEGQGRGNVSPIAGRSRSSTLPREIPGPDYFVKVPDGNYIAKFAGSEGFWYRGRQPRVVLWFAITEGDQKGARVAAYYNVKQLQGCHRSRRRNPRFIVGWRSDLTAHLSILFPDRYAVGNLPENIPEAELKGQTLLIETRTNAKTHDGSQRAEAFHYSVVKAILGWAE